jgi:hypothetical protein
VLYAAICWILSATKTHQYLRKNQNFHIAKNGQKVQKTAKKTKNGVKLTSFIRNGLKILLINRHHIPIKLDKFLLLLPEQFLPVLVSQFPLKVTLEGCHHVMVIMVDQEQQHGIKDSGSLSIGDFELLAHF